jgi:hypothetical protein
VFRTGRPHLIRYAGEEGQDNTLITGFIIKSRTTLKRTAGVMGNLGYLYHRGLACQAGSCGSL